MNTQLSTTFQNRTHRSGIALVIVLSMIVLLSAIMVAFMSRVSTEGRAAKIALQGFEARQAAETAVNLVISQLRAGTYDPTNLKRAWASQPGAIRTFSEGGDTEVYKLYSSDQMIQPAAQYKPSTPEEAGIDPSGDLSVTPVGYVNLNEPIFIPVRKNSGNRKNDFYYEAYFPICDPRAAKNLEGNDAPAGEGIIKGFSSAKIDQKSATPRLDKDGQEIPILPMNVRWLFQLRDGQLVAGKADGDKLEIKEASKNNPPIARVAFWTDDESTKLNLNTASENTYWDSPHSSNEQESGRISNTGQLVARTGVNTLSLAASQPSASEYQRFPGHPATTSLSPVLRSVFPIARLRNDWPEYTDQQFKEVIYRLAPRIYGGVGSTMAASLNPLFPEIDNRVPDRDRLLATVDDYFFRPDRSPLSQKSWYSVFQQKGINDPKQQDQPGSDEAQMLDIANPYFTPEALQRMRFFLTTTSRAPELNLYGLPRMSIWPVNYETDPRNAPRLSSYDKLIAFCSTIGGDPLNTSKGAKFYFQRTNPWSGTEDMTLDQNRNQELYDYMLTLMGKTHPAEGGDFVTKFGIKSTQQVLTAMFDYIRCTNLVDTHDGNSDANIYPLAYTAPYGGKTAEGIGDRGYPGSGQVVPLRIKATLNGTETKGYGRFPTVAEVALVFYYDDTTLPAQGLPSDDAWAAANANSMVPMRCALAIEMFTPSPGYPNLVECYAMSVKEMTPFSVVIDSGSGVSSPVALNLGSDLLNYVNVDSWRGWDGRFFMPTRGFANQLAYEDGSNAPKMKVFRKSSPTALPIDEAYKTYPFVSKRFTMPGQGGQKPTTFELRAGKLQIKLHPIAYRSTGVLPSKNAKFIADTSPNSVIQTLEIDFGAANALGSSTILPVPTAGVPLQSRDVTGILENPAVPDGGVQTRDTVRSMEVFGLTRGDYRLSAGKKDVKPEYFTRSGIASDYTPAKSFQTAQLHNLRSSWGRKIARAQTGNLVVGNQQRTDKVAKTHASLTTQGIRNLKGRVGDFDRGLSKNIDGPFINKPDEGNIRFNFTSDSYDTGGAIPYYRGSGGYEEVGETYFSPNRLISSAVMFGSLPTGVESSPARPWETLLFRPGPYNNPESLIGNTAPHDHYILDFFHMPVVEPYAISEPLSTSGKVNINCRLAPFGYYPDPLNAGHDYIERYSGIHGLLTGMYQMAVNNGALGAGHGENPLTNTTRNQTYRLKIDPALTVNDSFSRVLKEKGYFRSASEICEVDLLTNERSPIGPRNFDNWKDRDNYWENDHAMTGDNQRERPYAHIYPRTTTKSNVFTVHIWSQSLVKAPASDPEVWDDSKDTVTGEYRGSTIIERFIDPNDKAFKVPGDYEDPAVSQKSLEPLYRYRIVSNKSFTVRE